MVDASGKSLKDKYRQKVVEGNRQKGKLFLLFPKCIGTFPECVGITEKIEDCKFCPHRG